MALQSNRLGMIALSVLGDKPPNALQPMLADGIHLRWVSARDVGFPWSGYYLFRRRHDPQKLTQYQACLSKDLIALGTSIDFKASTGLKNFVFTGGELSSNVDLKLMEPLSGGEAQGFDLLESRGIWFSPAAGESIWRANVTLRFRQGAEIEIRAYFGERLVGQTKVKGEAGEISSALVEFSAVYPALHRRGAGIAP